MVAPSLTLLCCLLAQDAGAPPAMLAAPPPQAGAPAQPSSRRPRSRAQAVPEAAAAQPPPFHAQPVDSQLVDPTPPDQAGPAQVDAAAQAGPRSTTDDVPLARPRSARPSAPTASPASVPAAEIDPNLSPAARLEPATENHPVGSPGAVLTDALGIDAVLEASGAPMRLVDVLGRARDPRVRLTAIDAYWGVSLAWIAAHWQWSDHDCVARMEAMSPAAADPAQQLAREAKFRARLHRRWPIGSSPKWT